MIPLANPRARYHADRAAVDAAVMRVLEGGAYILGAEVEAFEAEFAAWLGTDHAVGVASGTDAIQVALRALGIGPGDEVITTAFTAVGTVAAIEQAGAVPVLADLDPDTLMLDPAAAERAVGLRTRALLPVHLYGAPASLEGADGLLDVARRHGLFLVEDASQAHGAVHHGRRVGTFGDVGCFSCYPTKNLGALGDAGVLVTADAAVAERARRIRQYGWDADRLSGFPGLNSRLDALQAAVLRARLPGLEAANERRRAIAARYDAALAQGASRAIPVAARAGDLHAYHLYTVRTRDASARAALRDFLAARGIETRIHYATPLHRQEAYRGRFKSGDAGGDSLPVTDRAAAEVLSIPMHPDLSPEDVETVAAALRDFNAAFRPA